MVFFCFFAIRNCSFAISSYTAPVGLCHCIWPIPRASPWARLCQPFRLQKFLSFDFLEVVSIIWLSLACPVKLGLGQLSILIVSPERCEAPASHCVFLHEEGAFERCDVNVVHFLFLHEAGKAHTIKSTSSLCLCVFAKGFIDGVTIYYRVANSMINNYTILKKCHSLRSLGGDSVYFTTIISSLTGLSVNEVGCLVYRSIWHPSEI